MDIGSLFGAIVSITFFSIPLALSMWALLDCAHRPAWAWALSGRSRQVWMYLILCGILLLLVGLIISLYYLLRVRHEIADIEDGHISDLGAT